MSKDLRTIVEMFLIAVTFTLGYFATVPLLNAAQIQKDSLEAIQIDEADLDEIAKAPEVGSKLLPVVKQPVEVTALSAAGKDEPAAVNTTERSGAIQILTKESFNTWINPLIFLFLVVCFLCWLLALFTRRSAGEVSGSTGESADQNITAASLAAPNSATSNSATSNSATSNSATSKTAGASGESMGRLFAKKPDKVDDLTKIGGIEAHDAKRLNEAGIWQYEQLRNMTAQQRANLQRRLNLPHIRWYSLIGLSDVSTASLATESKNSLTAGGETAMTRFDSAAPKDSVRSSKLHSPTEAKGTATGSKAVASTVGQGGSNLKSTQGVGSSTSSGKPATDGAEATKTRVDSSVAKNESVGSPKFGSKPGVKATAAATIAAAGLASASLKSGKGSATPTSPGKTASNGGPAADGKSASGGGSTKVSNATSGGNTSATKAAMSVAGSPVVTDGETKRDDLTRLAGIDSAAAARLNAAGIHSFDQLKDLDDQQASQLAEKCRIPNADVSDWRRCIYAWGRGIETTSETDETFASAAIHGIELPQIASGVFDGEKLVAYPEQVIFRGSNPEGWGRGGRESIDGVEASLSCDSIRSDINFLRIRRTDTRESVIVPMTKGQLFANGDSSENGWNGSSEVFFGGRHIGVFAQHLPQEVETKFSQGGWGFGHRYDHNDRQEWGWAGRVIEPTSFEVSVGCIGDTPGTVVFRGSDPSIWNSKARDGDNGFADPIDTVKHPVNFVRIMRQATGEAVIVRVDGNHILDEGFDPRCGWNGSCSEFSGGQHLGVYHCDLAQDFETRFEFGGWGFGHPYNDNDRQAWGWAGRQLPETIFEISLLENVPDFMQHELVE